MSPYLANNPTLKLNHVNLERIKANESSTGPNFKVAVISDTHNYYDQFEKMVTTINGRGPYSFVIVSGDITNLGLIDEFDQSRKILNKLKFPYLVGLGNHDLLANGDIIFKKMFGESEFTLEYNNSLFVFFNNNNWESPGSAPDLEWVEAQLSGSAASHKILVAHVSPTDKDRFPKSQVDSWENMISTQQVDYFINGHDHNPGEKSFGGGTQVTVGAPSKGVFLELTFTSGGVTHQKISF